MFTTKESMKISDFGRDDQDMEAPMVKSKLEELRKFHSRVESEEQRIKDK
jgi:Cyclin, N-terminal domain